MFSLFRKKTPSPTTDDLAAPTPALPEVSTPPVDGGAETGSDSPTLASTFASIKNWFAGALDDTVEAPVSAPAPAPAPATVAPPVPMSEPMPSRPDVASFAPTPFAVPPIEVRTPLPSPPHATPPTPAPPSGSTAAPVPAAFAAPPVARAPAVFRGSAATPVPPAFVAPIEPVATPEPERRHWLDKLTAGLRKTGTSIAQVFTGTQIDDALYEELESALLLADAGVQATEYLLADLKRRVKESRAADPQAVRGLLVSALTDLLKPLESGLVIGEHMPTVIMVVGVNGAGKTTSIGKLTRHLAEHGETVLLAAADTFRAAAKEQLAIWAGRNNVEIVSQEGGDPSAVTFDAVVAGAARGRDVVIADTAGRLPTQTHLMEELKKIKRTIGKAQGGAPHEILLVVDGNTGQNALSQVKSFDETLGLTGLIITKLDGTAKGGVLAAIALWSRERARTSPMHRPVPVYFVGVGEKLEDLETFDAREFALALLT